MDTTEQNKAFEAALEQVLAAREKMAEVLEDVFRVGMSLRYLRGDKYNKPAVGDLLVINAEANTLVVRNGRKIESIEALHVTAILDMIPDDEEADEEDDDTSHGWRGADDKLISAREFEEGMERLEEMSDEEREKSARKMSGYTGPVGGPGHVSEFDTN